MIRKKINVRKNQNSNVINEINIFQGRHYFIAY